MFVFCFSFSFGQSIVPRSNGSLTVQDSNWFGGNSFRVPVFNDTTQANTRRPSLDSAGKVIFTRDRNWFWGRQTSPERKWIPFDNTSNQLNSSCGFNNNTHRITWDSLLTFDVTGGPYVLCCDGIPRATIDGTITLPPNDSDFQRIDLIILDSNGVNFIQGEPALNPSTPQADSCQLILSYVLINAHDSVPAFITPTNPLVIYDENYDGEWIVDSTRNTTLDTADMAFPVHLTHDIYVSSHSNPSEIFLSTDNSIDLNDYTLLKLYVRRTSASSSLVINLTWYLDNVQQTLTNVQVTPTLVGYNTYVVPLTGFQIIGSTIVNRLKIQISGQSTQPFYIDWIQLQSGAVISNQGNNGTVTSVGMNNLDSLLIPSVTNPTTTPVFSFTKFNVPAHRVLINPSDITAPYSWSQIDLGTSVVTGLLPPINIAPSDSNDYVLTTVNNQTVWMPRTDSIPDTTFVGNWLVRRFDPDTYNDTLYFGYSMQDTALLSFDTYLGLDNHFVSIRNGDNDFLYLDATPGNEDAFIQAFDGTNRSIIEAISRVGSIHRWQLDVGNGTNDVLLLGDADTSAVKVIGSRFEEDFDETPISSANDLTLGNHGNVFTITGNTQINAISWDRWQSGSQVELIFTGTPTVKNNTTGGAGTAAILLAGSTDFTAAANDVLSLVFDGTNWHESARKTSGTVTSQTLQQTFNTEVGGSVLTKTDTIQVGSNILKAFGTGIYTFLATTTTNFALSGQATSNGIGVFGSSASDGGNGVQGEADGGTSSIGVWGRSSLGTGIQGTSNSGLSAIFSISPSDANTIVPVIKFQRLTSGTPSAGIGGSIDFETLTSDGTTTETSNQFIWDLTTATTGSIISQFKITGALNSSTVDLMTWNADGSVQWRPITATAASAITPAEGMIVFVSNTNGTFTTIGFWGYQNSAWHAF